MSRKLTSEQFLKDGELKLRCQKIIENPDFQDLLRAAYSRLGPYRMDMNFSEKEHVQARIDGGRAAAFAFMKELTTLPYKQINQEDSNINQFIDPIDALDATLV